MQTLSFHQSNRAPTERLIFNCHQEAAARQPIDHRAICSAVRAWAAAEGRVSVALQLQEAAEELQLDGVDFSGQADVWNVKLFRWLDNKEDSASYRKNVEQLVPAIMSVLPLRYRDRVVKNDLFAYRMARLEKEVSEAKQALMLDAPKKEKLKELGEGIFEMFRVDPDLTAPLLAMVTTMLGAM
ncbi:toxin YdaT domain-containing protein [Lelliottia amnigena]|uniref:toxin YdaT domain-containing protein n=1 Tax=Lelliottia amnigena TaxID=61646 RepID=UPI0021D9B447|nr:toxin YdaT domain-containing protein [Lelliottia amnigena]MCU7781981.1 toxin YdaT domain-containing protein [Lelliottia amnigena]